MAEPTLTLAPHELEPNRRAAVDGKPFGFRALWFNREREFVGQVIGQHSTLMIFFALADEPERGNFVNAPVFVSTNPGQPNLPIYEPRTQIPLDEETAKRCLELSANDGWGRLFFVDEDLQPTNLPVWRLFIAQGGWGQWSGAPDYYMKSARFRWNDNDNEARAIAFLPPLELLEHLRSSLLAPNSDAAHARRFAPLPGKKRHQLCRPLQRGSYEEWEQVVRWFIQSRTQLWAHRKFLRVQVEVNPRPEDSGTSTKTLFNFTFPRFFNWTRHYFAPTIDLDLLSHCVAAKQWHKRRFSWSERIPCPTQHERLEALLQLREWLSDKAAPEEIGQLLCDD